MHAHRSASWWPALAWLLLLLAGQGAALVLIRAGSVVGYQHYEPARLLQGGWTGRAAGVVLLVQLLLVVWGLRRHAPGIRRWWGAHASWPLTLLAALVLAGLSAAPSLWLRAYASELAFATGIQALALGTLLCFAASLPAPHLARWQALADRWLGPERGEAPLPGPFLDRTALVAAGWATAVALVLVIVAYERIPHVPDEIVYLLHARYFAAGQLALPAPPVPEAFDVDLMYLDAERWFSPVPPGWPALLALGAAARAAWLVNPLLTGLAVLLTHAVLRELYPPRVARGATLLLAASPWLLFLGMSFMTHMATLVFALLATLGVARARRLALAWPALVGGLALGVVSLIRPLEGLAVALLLGIWSLGARGRRWRFAPSALLIAGAAAACAIVRPYNAALTGSASRFPIMLYVDRYYEPGANDLGFGANRGLGWTALDPFPGHGWRDVVVNAVLNGYSINVELFGWITGSLGLVALLLVARRRSRADWAMLAAIAVIAGIHSVYWFSGGPDFGARYWFLAIVPLCALSASGLRVLWSAGTGDLRPRATLAVAALCVSSVLLFIPWRAADKYRGYRRMEPAMQQLAERQQFTGNDVILVRGPRHPDYHAAAIFNPVDLQAARPVYAWDRSREVRAGVVRAYPGRRVWIVDGPTLTGDGFTVRAGPLPPGSLAPEIAPTQDLEELTRRERSR